MCTLTNSEDHYEMPHNASVHKGLCCLLLKAKTIFGERNTILFGNSNQ